MTNTADANIRWADAHRHFFTHLAIMPMWHKAVILIAGALAVLGTLGQIVARTSGDASSHVTHVTGGPRVAPPAGSSGFVTDNGSPGDTVETTPPAGMIDSLSPHATKVGLSVVLGFIVGWFFRAFLKTMAFLGILVVGGLWALSHFGILNLSDANLDALKQHSAEATSWLQEHATHLKELAISHLPSTGGGAFGAFLGFRRR
jgi:uncharacterized membrane protein (Fun14 family)